MKVAKDRWLCNFFITSGPFLVIASWNVVRASIPSADHGSYSSFFLYCEVLLKPLKNKILYFGKLIMMTPAKPTSLVVNFKRTAGVSFR